MIRLDIKILWVFFINPKIQCSRGPNKNYHGSGSFEKYHTRFLVKTRLFCNFHAGFNVDFFKLSHDTQIILIFTSA